MESSPVSNPADRKPVRFELRAPLPFPLAPRFLGKGQVLFWTYLPSLLIAMSVRLVNTVLCRSGQSLSACTTRPKPRSTFLQSRRRFATHRDPLPSSLLTSALDQKQRNSTQGRNDSVGPFALGVQPSFRQGEKVKKWSELSTGGKGMHHVLSCNIR